MVTDDQILTEVVKLLASIPDKSTFRHDLPQNHEWLGSVIYVLRQSEDISLAADAKNIAAHIGDKPITIRDPQSRLIVLLQQVKREFEFRCGYAIPLNYIELPEDSRTELAEGTESLREAVAADNSIDPDDREILLSEIAIFEASIGATRLSSDLIARFVNGVLRGSIILAANAIVQECASILMRKILSLLGWE